MKKTYAMMTSLALGFLSLAQIAGAETIYVSTSNQILRFDSATPGNVISTQTVTGMQGGETILGLDVRPVNGQLYALGSTGRLYRIDPGTAGATPIGGAPITLSGTRFGFDFNPTVDRIRLVSNQGQNLRLHPDTGAIAFTDTTLAYAVGDVNAGDNPVVSGAAYTNSISGTTTTLLYDIDLNNGILVTQNPPNSGTLNTVGPLGVSPADGNVSFDISGRTGLAYAAISTGASTNLYRISLETGQAVSAGAIGGGSLSGVTGIAVAASEGSCIPSTTALCLNDDRFRVTATFQRPDGTAGVGQPVTLTSDTGYFWFFSPTNVEVVVKVLDACAAFDRTWVFASGLTDVGVILTVTDTEVGISKTYNNPIGTAFQPIQDTSAFSTCP